MSEQSSHRKARNFILFGGCVLFWIIIDRISKTYLESNFKPGQVVCSNVLGLFQFDLLHNKGAAWGMFAGGVMIFALIAIVICLVVCFFVFKYASEMSSLEIVGLGLLVAGGIANCIDRLFYGYVVDFITPTFIDFPTFNIADIGVTCGIILAAIGYIIRSNKTSSDSSLDKKEG